VPGLKTFSTAVPLIAYRLQPWDFVDRLVLDLCPPAFQIVPMAPSRFDCSYVNLSPRRGGSAQPGTTTGRIG